MSILVKNGLALLRENGKYVADQRDIFIDDDTIVQTASSLSTNELSAERVIDATDMLVMPGIVNSHLHSNENLWRGMWDNLPDEIWSVHCYPVSGYDPPDERLIYLRTMLGAIEMLKCGVTWARDEVFELPKPSPGSVDAIMQAYRDSGIRADLSLTMIDTPPWVGLPWMDELMPPDIREFFENSPMPATDELIELCTDAIKRWDRVDGRLRFALGPHSPQRCSHELLLETEELSRKHNLPYNIHVLETITQLVQAQDIYADYGGSTVKFMEDLGILSPRATFAHAIWVTDEEIKLMGESGVSVAHNIVSNLELGSGVMPFRKMLDANVNLCLGTDGMSGGAETQSMLEVMKFAALIHKATSPYYEDWPSSHEVLDAATHGGARSAVMGDQIGLLAEGYRADMALLDLTTVPFTPLNDIPNQLVYSETGESVRMVIVNGQVVVEDGKLTLVDEESLMAEFRERMPAWRDAYEAGTKSFRERWEPVVDKMHRRAASTPIHVNRFITAQELWQQ